MFKREGILKAEAQKIVRKSASWLLKRGFKIFRRKVTCEGVTVDTFNHLSPNSDHEVNSEMKSGLLNASFSLPKWQAVKMSFFAPCYF